MDIVLFSTLHALLLTEKESEVMNEFPTVKSWYEKLLHDKRVIDGILQLEQNVYYLARTLGETCRNTSYCRRNSSSYAY